MNRLHDMSIFKLDEIADKLLKNDGKVVGSRRLGFMCNLLIKRNCSTTQINFYILLTRRALVYIMLPPEGSLQRVLHL